MCGHGKRSRASVLFGTFTAMWIVIYILIGLELKLTIRELLYLLAKTLHGPDNL